MKARIIQDLKGSVEKRVTQIEVECDLSTLQLLMLYHKEELTILYQDITELDFEKVVKSVKENPFIPIAWQTVNNDKQKREYIQTEDAKYVCISGWLEARDSAVKNALWLKSCNLTDHLCNKLLEPFMLYTVFVTAVEWEDFFSSRCPKYTDGENTDFRSKKDYLDRWGFTNKPDGTDERKDALEDEKFWFEKNKGQSEIHMMALAEAMWDAYNKSTPIKV
jgi:hypothetical protein